MYKVVLKELNVDEIKLTRQYIHECCLKDLSMVRINLQIRKYLIYSHIHTVALFAFLLSFMIICGFAINYFNTHKKKRIK